jgi:peptidoglycan/xylan/chitin deacetylase (PgdA/CDA1 family)
VLVSGSYLLRFDDICPTMNWSVWDRVEALLYQYGVRPLLAAVPDNQDPHLDCGRSRADFWHSIRRWQSDGWGIGLHGYQHRYTTSQRGLWGRADRSEFAGLALEEQEDKLRRGIDIFSSEGVNACAWIAPGHSFDRNTLVALKRFGLNVVSDGYFLGPRIDADGIIWVPQQLGALRSMPFGLWTICLHINSWGATELRALELFLRGNQRRITDLSTVLRSERCRPVGAMGDKLLDAGIRALRLARSA